MSRINCIVVGSILLTSTFAAASSGPGIVCTERNQKPNGAFLSYERGRGTKPTELKWAGLETSNQILLTESEWPLGTYAGVSPYDDHVVLTIHTVVKNPTPKSEFIGTLTFFEFGEPRVDTADCYFKP